MKTKRVVALKTAKNPVLSKQEAQKQINRIAQTTANIKYTSHAFERRDERTITIRDVERILQNGFIADTPLLGDKGDWKYLVRYTGLEGTKREAGCVTIILRSRKLLVVTVEWIDL